MTAQKHLLKLLDSKDKEIEELTTRINDLESKINHLRGGWTLHVTLPKKQKLPVPRLELVYEQLYGWSEYAVNYHLVYRHLLGHCVAVPLGRTTIHGSHESTPIRVQRNGQRFPDMPFREGAHFREDMKTLKLPGFLICDGEVFPYEEEPPETSSKGQ